MGLPLRGGRWGRMDKVSPCGCSTTNVVRAVRRLPLVIPAPVGHARSQQQWGFILAVLLVEVVPVSAADTPPSCPLGGDGTSLALLGLCMRRSGRDRFKMKERIDISLRKPKIFTKAE